MISSCIAAAGQTCIAPDYALVPEASLQAFADKLVGQMRHMYGINPRNAGLTPFPVTIEGRDILLDLDDGGSTAEAAAAEESQ